MTFSWSPPAPTERNGVITGYSLSCVPEAGGGSSISMQYITAGTFTLGGFTPATSYNCSISARNSQGSGPATHRVVTTLDDSGCCLLLVLKLALLYSHIPSTLLSSNVVSVAAEWYWSERLSGMGSKYNLY